MTHVLMILVMHAITTMRIVAADSDDTMTVLHRGYRDSGWGSRDYDGVYGRHGEPLDYDRRHDDKRYWKLSKKICPLDIIYKCCATLLFTPSHFAVVLFAVVLQCHGHI